MLDSKSGAQRVVSSPHTTAVFRSDVELSVISDHIVCIAFSVYRNLIIFERKRKIVLLANFFQTTALHTVFSLFCPNWYQEVPLRQTKKIKGVY